MSRLRTTTLMVAAAVLTTCSAGDDALLIGRLFGDASIPCVWIGGPKAGIEVDWPFPVDVTFDPIRVAGPGFVAVEGDWFRMGGGTRPDVPVTPSCPVVEPGSGKWVTNGIDYFGDERPSADLGTS